MFELPLLQPQNHSTGQKIPFDILDSFAISNEYGL